MPTIIRIGKLKFRIYPHDHRPAHVHVEKAGAEAKFEIKTGECLSANGFTERSIKSLSKKVLEKSELLLEVWREYEGED